ncbi:uncharacterized protein LOC102357995 [Latimeria chalumnae]|uniref:uncharacterized protein LOC102357995 n=1 Tax=Latimeria chalumnae TaxID=7897 RepID=UPI0003C10BF2|nr:PREDICTED: circadian-associated transcriptional repressor [Latimeria chalumnae]XP_006005409.1 PREDICTED: circadian-associated transcriptional repressor [Latimeria chalumnae]|eukprot:XP_006005408.1 PREDICTED: circadian-associated transcriptional repressor [Latimeria chalumnae]
MEMECSESVSSLDLLYLSDCMSSDSEDEEDKIDYFHSDSDWELEDEEDMGGTQNDLSGEDETKLRSTWANTNVAANLTPFGPELRDNGLWLRDFERPKPRSGFIVDSEQENELCSPKRSLYSRGNGTIAFWTSNKGEPELWKLQAFRRFDVGQSNGQVTLKDQCHVAKRVQNEEEKEKKRDLLNTEQETEFRTKGDQIFAQKCHELRDFVKPLMDLLNGLKTGRYEKGLSSFQQSVAMDRIQRIVGVLQNPWMGERYLGTLLQVEMMLKVWFPHVARKTPVLCETGPEDNKPQMLKLPHINASEVNCFREVQERESTGNSSSAASYKSEPGSESPGLETPHSLENSSVLKLTWMHTSPICIPLQASLGQPDSQTALGPDLKHYHLSLAGQDSSVSSCSTLPHCSSTSPGMGSCSQHGCPCRASLGVGGQLRCRSAPGTTLAAIPKLAEKQTHSTCLTLLPRSNLESLETEMETLWTGAEITKCKLDNRANLTS